MRPLLKLVYLLVLAIGLFLIPKDWGVWLPAALVVFHLGLWAVSGVDFRLLGRILRRLAIFFTIVALVHSLQRGDGFLMLPGGIGTYEEFFEILVGRQLREHDKPIGIVNSRGYFNPLVAMIEHGIEHRFIKPAIYELFRIDPDPVTVIDWLAHPPDVTIEDERFLPMGRSE